MSCIWLVQGWIWGPVRSMKHHPGSTWGTATSISLIPMGRVGAAGHYHVETGDETNSSLSNLREKRWLRWCHTALLAALLWSHGPSLRATNRFFLSWSRAILRGSFDSSQGNPGWEAPCLDKAFHRSGIHVQLAVWNPASSDFTSWMCWQASEPSQTGSQRRACRVFPCECSWGNKTFLQPAERTCQPLYDQEAGPRRPRWILMENVFISVMVVWGVYVCVCVCVCMHLHWFGQGGGIPDHFFLS